LCGQDDDSFENVEEGKPEGADGYDSNEEYLKHEDALRNSLQANPEVLQAAVDTACYSCGYLSDKCNVLNIIAKYWAGSLNQLWWVAA